MSWWKADGDAIDSVSGNNGTLTGNVSYVPGVAGQAFSFNGTYDSIQIPDADSLKITHSLTLKASVSVTAIPSGQGFIIFRGDDQGALDPYYLAVKADGNVYFHIEDATRAYAEVRSLIPTGRFTNVVGTLDDTSGQMNLYLDGRLLDHTTTSIRPFRDLDPTQHPGVAIGNHVNQPEDANYHYPLQGIIDDVKIYNVVSAPTASVFGDLNKDGTFNLADLVYGLRVYAGLDMPR